VVALNSQCFQVRFHGRGGQGVVTAAELLSVAAFVEGHYSQAFPTFGSERAGAPVTAFCRISDHEIRTRSPITAPDALIIQDPTLLHQPDLFAGFTEHGWALVNTTRRVEDLALEGSLAHLDRGRLVTVGATELAVRHLGRPLPNAVLLGAFAALCDVVSLDSVLRAIEQRFSKSVAEANCTAAVEAFGIVAEEERELSSASPD
jgi:pyruvate ferredoxin oxidoreductase gamma subunit